MFAVRRGQALRLGCLVLPLVAVLMGELQIARSVKAQYLRGLNRTSDLPKEIDRLLGPLNDVLPPYGNIGYIDPDHSWLNANATHQFYLTQYALAPRVLIYNGVFDYVIYFSHTEKPIVPEAVPADLRVLRQVRPYLAVLIRAK
jgi:hypothetical protein